MQKDPERLAERKGSIQDQLGCKGADEKVFQMVLYCSAVMNRSEDLGTVEMCRVKEIDKRLCALWRKILDPSYRKVIRRPPTPPKPPTPPPSRTPPKKDSSCSIA